MGSKHMDRTTKILLGGITAAALVVSGGYAASIRTNSLVSDLVARCKTENARTTTPKSQDGWETAPLICDPEILRTKSDNLHSVGIQAQIIDAQRQGERWLEQATDIAIGILILSIAPSAWYFLLRRVRELRDAIVGK